MDQYRVKFAFRDYASAGGLDTVGTASYKLPDWVSW